MMAQAALEHVLLGQGDSARASLFAQAHYAFLLGSQVRDDLLIHIIIQRVIESATKARF
jgi:hypothetical protein